MTARSYNHGNPTHFDENLHQWLDEDENPVGAASCPRCGKLPTPEGHDACIAALPGIRNACCGHGVGSPYLMFESEVSFQAAVIAIRRAQ